MNAWKRYFQLGLLVFLIGGMVSCSDSKDNPIPPKEEEKEEPQETQKPEVTADTEMNATIDEFLEDYYLWNDDYKKMSRDLTIPYVDAYENFLRSSLMKMTTNDLDKKKNADGSYKLYSYVDRTEKKSGGKSVASGVNHGIEKEDKVSSYGFSNLVSVSFADSKQLGFVVQSVYPASSASSFGVNRGTFIQKIDGEEITEDNLVTHYLELLQPTKRNVTLTVTDGVEEAKEVYLQTMEIDPTPILMHTILEEGAHKIGYLVYESFDAAYDNELLEVLSDFKSKGITDMVLDLRYNAGGHVITAKMLAASINGSSCKNQIFQYYRYNAGRMKDIDGTKRRTGNEYDSAAGYFYEKYLFDNYYGVNLGSYALNLPRLYVLTTDNSNSASELLINSLKGLDKQVVVIGENTGGKNVGMEVKEFDKGNYSYELAPITFQYYNAKKVTIPADGLKVDHAVADWNPEVGFVDFGKKEEPLLAKAIELITGASPKTTAKARAVAPLGVKKHTDRLPERKGYHPEGAIIF